MARSSSTDTSGVKMSQEVVVHELGAGFLVGNGKELTPEMEVAAKEMAQHQIDKMYTMLDGLKDIIYVEPFTLKEGPITDFLHRFKNYGFYGRIASPTYDSLEEHFKCYRRHIPNQLTREFIWELIEELHLQEEREREDGMEED